MEWLPIVGVSVLISAVIWLVVTHKDYYEEASKQKQAEEARRKAEEGRKQVEEAALEKTRS